MEMKSLNIPGLTDIKDQAAENLSGGQFTVNFITEDGDRIRRRVNTADSGTIKIPNDIARIRVRNRGDEDASFAVNFTNPNGDIVGIGESFDIGSGSGVTVFNDGDTFTGTNLDAEVTSFAPGTISVRQRPSFDNPKGS